MPRCVVSQVFASNNMCDALRAIVYHHGQLVSPQAVCPFEHEVAHFQADILLLYTQTSIHPGNVAYY